MLTGKKIGFYTLFVISLLVSSCSEQQYFVKGKSTQSTIDGEYAYMVPMNSTIAYVGTPQLLYLDSCRVVHGKFEMTGPLDSVQCVTIYMGSMRIPMVLETGEVSINYQNSNIQVSGTPLNDRFYSFLNTRDSLVFIQKELFNQVSAMDLTTENLDDYTQMSTSLKNVTAQIDSVECDFVRNNIDNVLGVSWFLHMCDEASNNAGRLFVPSYLEAIYENAPQTFRSNWAIRNYLQRCKNAQSAPSEYHDFGSIH